MNISKEIKAGLIAVLAIGSFVVFFQFLKGKNVFTTDNYFYIKYDNVDGLERSNAVTINGLKVGLVDDIIPITNKNGKISFLVRIAVENQYSFSKNSSVEIFEPSLMGGKQLKINLTYDQIIAQNGDTLKGKIKPSALTSVASDLSPKISNVLTQLDSTLTSTSRLLDEHNRKEIKLLLANLNQTLYSFKSTSDQTNQLLVESQPKINTLLKSANETMASTKNTLEKFGNVAEGIDTKNLNNSINKLSETANKLNSVIAGIEKGEGTLGKLTKDEELYNNLSKTSNSLNELIVDLKENPKRYINISIFGKSK